MQTMGLDLGFRQVKVSSKRSFKFDSVIGYPSAIELKDDNDSRDTLENLVIEENNEMYYVGEKAIRDTKNAQLTFNADKTNHKTDRIKMITAMGYAMDDKDTESFRLVTGLPVDELGIEGLKEQVIRNMTNTFQFSINGQRKTAQVETCNVIAQSAGAYYDYVLDHKGNVVESAINPKSVVIDIGYRTTDVVCMENAKYNPAESFTVYTGVHNIHTELRKMLLREHRIQKQPSEIDKIVRNGSITINNSTISLVKEIGEATRPFVEKILSELPLYIPNLHEVQLFLVAGGGSTLMSEYFENYLPSPVEIVKDPEMSNARGYHKYLHLLMKNGM